MTAETGPIAPDNLIGDNYQNYIKDLNDQMSDAAANLEFEEAAKIRDEIRRIEGIELGLHKSGVSKTAAAEYKPAKYKKSKKRKSKKKLKLID